MRHAFLKHLELELNEAIRPHREGIIFHCLGTYTSKVGAISLSLARSENLSQKAPASYASLALRASQTTVVAGKSASKLKSAGDDVGEQ